MEQDLLRLDGRIVVVSGAGGRGLGTTVTRMAARAGATVVAVDRTPEGIEQDIAPLIAEGLPIVPVAADVQTPEGVAAAMECVRGVKGALHGLVSVVGGGPAPTWGPSTQVSRENWQALFSKNLDSMFFISQAVAAELKARGRPGSLVAISSITAIGAQPYNVAYGAAKAAVLSVVRTMALELAASDIRVNAVAPGAMTTPASLLPPDPVLERRAIPMGRKGKAEEIAATVLFLLSDMAGYMTGQCLTVDGGISLKWSHLAEDNTPVLITNQAFLSAMKGE